MLDPLYTNTFVQNITSDVVAKTGLDWSEIELLLATQTSNCIKFEMDGQNVMVKQVTTLLPDQSNKDCFEASFEYEFCGQIMTYKVKLNIQLDEFCDVPTITDVTFADPNFTITGSITSDVFVEFSEDDGVTWERVLNAFPAGATIVSDDLPVEVDLKIRLVALCDETKISNVFDFNADEPSEGCFKFDIVVSETDLVDSDDSTIIFRFTNCDGELEDFLANNSGSFSAQFCSLDFSVSASYMKNGVLKKATNSNATLTSENC